MDDQKNNENSLNNNNNNDPNEYKSPFLLSDEDIKKLGIPEHNIEIFRRKHYQQQFSLSSWYSKDDLSSHTFKTTTFPLTWEQATSIMNHHHGKSISEEDKNELENLSKSIDQVIERDFKEKGCFLKLDTRSGKDVPVYDFDNQEVQDLIFQEISKIPKQKRNANSISIALIIATNRFLKLKNAKRAIYTLIKSQRISEDIAKVTQFGKNNFSTNIVLREWCDEMVEKPGFEFRAFVYNNQLNALTQYFDFCYFPEMEAQKSLISEKILKFHSSIKDKLHHEHYVIDFFFGKDKIYIIELNPFHIGAGACLFSWKSDRDIFVGKKDFEFRIIEKKNTKNEKWDPLDPMPIQWKKFIHKKFPKETSCILQ